MNSLRRSRLLPTPVVGLVVLAAALAGCSDSTSGTDLPSSTDAPSSEAPTTGSDDGAADASAEWLATTAVEPGAFDLESDGFTFTQHGLRADVVLSLLAAGDDATAGTLIDELTGSAAVTEWIGDGETALYAGSAAKLVAVLHAAGGDPRAVGDRDVVAELVALEAPSGRFVDLGEDYSLTVSQSWAVLALSIVDEGSPAAVDFLASQQCADGGFPAELADVPTGECESDADSTGFAVSALTAADADSATIDDAVAWFEESAGDDGASWAATGNTGPSVNTTAVVATALADAGQDTGPALEWLATQAIADGPDASALPVAAGDTAGDLRATAQASLALSGSGLAQVLGAQG